MSMHSFLPPSMFPLVNRSGDTAAKAFASDGPRSPPTRKLRKTRSNPQLSAAPEVSPDCPPDKPPVHTGRAHSHSVTGADMPRLPSVLIEIQQPPRGDVFSEVMQWTTAPSSPYSSSASSSRSLQQLTDENGKSATPAVIMHPFGVGVSFDSPSRRPDSTLILPHMLREMQSFESGLTARADPISRAIRPSFLPPLGPLSTTHTIDELPPRNEDSPITPSSPIPAPFISQPPAPDPSYLPTVETLMHTRYSTEVFDVLQTYRGLPLLDKISSDSMETTVIKMSLNANNTAAPRDDPRFVIWGEIYPDPDDFPAAQSSRTDASSRSGRRSGKGRDLLAEGNPDIHVSSAEGPQKVLVAATIERWLAQLTSELNYDELLIFFLTYRTYISAVDLCHLLICRFHWALGQPTSDHDEVVRRIVRVRSFVAMRYWLLTFFVIDFMPNRDLRLLLASWLNTLKRDPVLQKHNDAPVSPLCPGIRGRC